MMTDASGNPPLYIMGIEARVFLAIIAGAVTLVGAMAGIAGIIIGQRMTKTRERATELRKALIDFGAQLRQLVAMTEASWIVILEQMRLVDEKGIVKDPEGARAHHAKAHLFHSDFSDLRDKVEIARCRALLMEREKPRRTRISELAQECMSLNPKDLPDDLKGKSYLVTFSLRGEHCRKAVDGWIEEQAERKDL